MKKAILFLMLGVSSGASAQFVIGTGGLTVQPGATLTFDSLVLQPSTTLTVTSNEVRRSETPVGSITGATGIDRVYQFTTPLIFTGTAGFFYRADELGPNTESMLKLAYESGSNWITASGSTLNTTTKFISQSFPGTTFSRLTATSAATPLPVSLLQFTAYKVSNRQAALKWKVYEERNANSYQVERSPDGKLFDHIGTVAATGHQEYSFIDDLPGKGMNYYRLKMIDGNMDAVYSPVRQLLFDKDRDMITIAPNPASHELAINVHHEEWIGQEAKVYDMTGNLMTSIVLSGMQTNVSVSSWPQGLYLLRIGNDWSLKLEKR